MQLHGTVTFSNTAPAIEWKLNSGPGAVTFGNAAQTNTTATFTTPGTYTFMLSANNGVHAVAFDAVMITVGQGIALSAAPVGTNLNLIWNGGTAPFVIERSTGLSPTAWILCATSTVPSVSVPMTNLSGFFRVRGN